MTGLEEEEHDDGWESPRLFGYRLSSTVTRIIVVAGVVACKPCRRPGSSPAGQKRLCRRKLPLRSTRMGRREGGNQLTVPADVLARELGGGGENDGPDGN